MKDIQKSEFNAYMISQLHIYLFLLNSLLNQCTNGSIRTYLLLCAPNYFLNRLANFHFNLLSTMYPSYTYRVPLKSFSSSCIFSTCDDSSFCSFRVKAVASKVKYVNCYLELNEHIRNLIVLQKQNLALFNFTEIQI